MYGRADLVLFHMFWGKFEYWCSGASIASRVLDSATIHTGSAPSINPSLYPINSSYIPVVSPFFPIKSLSTLQFQRLDHHFPIVIPIKSACGRRQHAHAGAASSGAPALGECGGLCNPRGRDVHAGHGKPQTGGEHRRTGALERTGLVSLPSGKLTFCYGKSQFLMGKSTISTGPFSIAMLNYQRVDQKTHCGTTKTTFCLQVYVQRKSWWNWGQCWFPHSASTLAFTEGLENMSQFLGVDFPVFWWRWFWCMPLTTKAYGLLSKLRQEPWQSLKSA